MIVTIEADATPPRIKIETTATTVTRVNNGTSTSVRGSVVDGVIYDHECPQEQAVTYDDGLTTSALVELPNVGLWLVHLTAPELSQRIRLWEPPTRSLAGRSSIASIPMRRLPVVRTFTRSGPVGALMLRTDHWDDLAALEALLDDGTILFLSPPALYGGLTASYVVIGDADVAHFFSWNAPTPIRRIPLSYVEVDRPAWVEDSSLTWESLPSTWGALASTWDGLVQG